MKRRATGHRTENPPLPQKCGRGGFPYGLVRLFGGCRSGTGLGGLQAAARTRLEIQYGGGIKSRTALCDVFSAGARRAVCGSVAVREPDCLAAWLAEFGGERLILGADLRDGRIAIAGWSEETPLGAAELIGRFRKQGLQQVICTDIARDGMLCGPATSFYAALQAEFPDVEITVSGGIATLGDLTALDRAGLRSVIVGKALYEGRITLEDLGRCLPNE